MHGYHMDKDFLVVCLLLSVVAVSLTSMLLICLRGFVWTTIIDVVVQDNIVGCSWSSTKHLSLYWCRCYWCIHSFDWNQDVISYCAPKLNISQRPTAAEAPKAPRCCRAPQCFAGRIYGMCWTWDLLLGSSGFLGVRISPENSSTSLSRKHLWYGGFEKRDLFIVFYQRGLIVDQPKHLLV